jgi:hypothetical protein
MSDLTNVQWIQMILIGIGILCVGLPPAYVYWLSRRESERLNFYPAPVAAPVPVVVRVPKVVDARQYEIDAANAYQPVPPAVLPYIPPFPSIEPALALTDSGKIKKTARMKIAEVLSSSKQMLKAIQREVLPSSTRKQIQFLFAGVALGPFSEEEVRRYMGEGFLAPSDLAKDESAEEWTPLQNILAELFPANVRSPSLSNAATSRMKTWKLQGYPKQEPVGAHT